jgi:hypothetical protein
MEFDGRQFELTDFSPVREDGTYLELDELTSGNRVTVADVFYSDADGTMTFSAFQRDLPLAAIEWLIARARESLIPPADAV